MEKQIEKQRFIFDIDGTLLEVDWVKEINFFKSILSHDDSTCFIPQIGLLLKEYERAHNVYSVSELSKFLTERTGINISDKIIYDWIDVPLCGEVKIIDGVVESLDYLKAHGKSMVILTNWFLDSQRRRLEKAGLDKYFDEIYGGEVGLKPHVESFYQAIGPYSLDESIMIGDSLELDICGATAAGLDAIYYKPQGDSCFDKEKVKSIGSMKEIRRLF